LVARRRGEPPPSPRGSKSSRRSRGGIAERCLDLDLCKPAIPRWIMHEGRRGRQRRRRNPRTRTRRCRRGRSCVPRWWAAGSQADLDPEDRGVRERHRAGQSADSTPTKERRRRCVVTGSAYEDGFSLLVSASRAACGASFPSAASRQGHRHRHASGRSTVASAHGSADSCGSQVLSRSASRCLLSSAASRRRSIKTPSVTSSASGSGPER
jgi:hypothetical protein